MTELAHPDIRSITTYADLPDGAESCVGLLIAVDVQAEALSITDPFHDEHPQPGLP